jgi:glycosyltransferase involved in cell wall biosynthesis
MNIAHVVAGLPLGGAETLVLNLSLWQQRAGHRVLIVNIHDDTTLEPIFGEHGIHVTHLHLTPVVSWWLPLSLTRCLMENRVEIVHAHNAAWRKSVVAARYADIPCIWTLHGYHTGWLRQQRRWIRSAVRYTRFLVGVEQGVTDLIRSEVKTSGIDQAVCIPNGVPDGSLAPLAEDVAAKLPARGRVIGMATRMAPPKDHFTLLRAFHIVQKELPDVRLLLVGDGVLRAEIEALSNHLGIAEKVTFTGYRSDVASVIKLVDVFVHSSLSESISVAILEAMSVQRPIVATAVGGTPGLLANGECGLLVPPGDVEAMAQAILELLTNKTKAEELARRARGRFLQEYTIDRMGERYLELYLRAVRETKRV